MSAVVNGAGVTRQLDRRATATERVTKEQVADADRLARLIQSAQDRVAELERPWRARTVAFEDVAVDATGTTKYRFYHGFGGRVRYWPGEWSGASAPNLRKHTDTTNDVLVLTSTSAGTVTVCIEEAG